jgi:hypothetical protein
MEEEEEACMHAEVKSLLGSARKVEGGWREVGLREGGGGRRFGEECDTFWWRAGDVVR